MLCMDEMSHFSNIKRNFEKDFGIFVFPSLLKQKSLSYSQEQLHRGTTPPSLPPPSLLHTHTGTLTCSCKALTYCNSINLNDSPNPFSRWSSMPNYNSNTEVSNTLPARSQTLSSPVIYATIISTQLLYYKYLLSSLRR